MPRVLFDHVVSFSSEDPAHPASNLVTGGGRWICEPNGNTCSVVMALAHSTRLFSLQVGALGAALVEVLVGRSETPGNFQVLVASSVFLSPAESRRAAAEVVGPGTAGERVRGFSRDQMCPAVRDQPWDRLRVVCTQPYVRKPKVGLAFVHVFEEEPPTATVRVSPPPLVESTPYRPGDLFRNYRSPTTPNNTYAQIRRTDADIMKGTPPPRTPSVRSAHQQHCKKLKREDPTDSPDEDDTDSGERRGRGHKRKLDKLDNKTERRGKPHTPKLKDVGQVLRGVVFGMSGYENPERGELRAAGVQMGAVYCPRGGATCTHLICAFSKTPKLRALREEEKKRGVSPRAGVQAVTGEWFVRCRSARRRLPSSWFAVEPALRTSEYPLSDIGDSDEKDTDDEIENVLRSQGGGGGGDDTDEESPRPATPALVDSARCLPDLFRGRAVYISSDVTAAGYEPALLARYVRAYGGRVARSADDDDSCVALRAGRGEGGVRPDWLWACHERGALLPTEPYCTDHTD